MLTGIHDAASNENVTFSLHDIHMFLSFLFLFAAASTTTADRCHTSSLRCDRIMRLADGRLKLMVGSRAHQFVLGVNERELFHRCSASD